MINEYFLSSRSTELKNDWKENYLTSALEEPVITSTLISEEMESEKSFALFESTTVDNPVCSSDSVEDLVLYSSEITVNKEELDCVSEKIVDDSHNIMPLPDKIEDVVSDSPEETSNKELDSVSGMIIEDHSPSVTLEDEIEDPFADKPDIASSKEEVICVSEKIAIVPHSSPDRIENPVPLPVEFSSSQEVNCVSHDITQDTHPSMDFRDSVGENQHPSVPDRLESEIAAAPETVSDIFSLISVDLF